MQYPKITLSVLLLPSALALPSINNGHGHGFKHEHKPHKSGTVSGAPFPSGTGGPFGLNNATSSAAGSDAGSALINTNTLYTTLHNTIYQTVPAASGAPALSATAASDSGAGSCAAAPVTVTYNPTVTVTVGGSDGAPAESPVQSASVVSSSSAAIASASSAPEALETSAPPVSSVSPAVFSSTAAPKTSQAPVSTQAASSALVASSVAPVQSVSASPIGLSPQSVPVLPSVVPSSTAAAASGNTAGSTKRGMVIPAGGVDTPYQVAMVNKYPAISWVSSWFSISPHDLHNDTAEFVPQMYGLDSYSNWDQNAQEMVKNGSKHFLAFGEPETYTTSGPQLHQDPATAAANWKKWMAPYSSKGKVGSPCTLQSWKPDQLWQAAFLADCTGCNIDFIAMHWVDKVPPGKGAFQAQGFMDVVLNYTQIAGSRKVWIDNIQADGANEDQLDFLKVIIPYLENNNKVERYAYWSPERKSGTGFLNSDGSMSSLGEWYATYK